MVVISIVKVKKIKLVNYKQIIIQTPSAVDEQKEIFCCCKEAVTFFVCMKSLSLEGICKVTHGSASPKAL